MSKKVKGSSVKKPIKKAAKKPAVKKAAPKKQVKKVTKSVTKAAPKKVTPKKVSNSKKVVPKKAIKKSIKPAPKPAIKKIVKKKDIVTKKTVSKPVKKIVVKKVVKPTVSAISKKKVSTAPKKELVKLTKKVETKKPEKIIQKVAVVEKKVKEEPKKKEAPNTGPEVLAITNVIPKVERVELSASKIASITSSITNPVKKVEAYAVKPEKEPNGKFEMEYITRASAEMLYEFLATPSGLSEWFCDDVNIRNGIFTFIWDGQMQQARLLKTIDEQLVRFQWVDKTDGSYFEFRIQRDDLTNDISLIITDFADSKSDQESAKLLWNNQVDKLMHVLGSVY
jgi:uncharacterized protein YndB with AHSA1/START domain